MCVQNLKEREYEIFPHFASITNVPLSPPKKAPLYDSSVLLASGEDGDQPYLLDVATGEEEGQSYMLSTRGEFRKNYISTFYISGKVVCFKATFPYVIQGQITQN